MPTYHYAKEVTTVVPDLTRSWLPAMDCMQRDTEMEPGVVQIVTFMYIVQGTYVHIQQQKFKSSFYFQLYWTANGVEFFSWIKKYIKSIKIIFEVIFSSFFLKIFIWIRIRILNLDPQPWIENDVYGLLIHVFVIIRLYWNANKVFFSWEKNQKFEGKKIKNFEVVFSYFFSK